MSKTSKKRSFLKISKWGKFLKLKRSKKKESEPNCEQEQFHEANKTKQEQETTSFIIEKTTGNNDLDLGKEIQRPTEQVNSESRSFEKAKMAVKIDLCRSFEQDTKSNGGSSSHVLDKKVESECITVAVENDDQLKSSDKGFKSAIHVNSSPGESQGLVSLVLDEELVIVQTPLAKQPEKRDLILNTKDDENEEDLAFPILHTPSPKNKKTGYSKYQVLSARKDTSKKNGYDIHEEDLDVKRERVSTVRKIRSIIATPYKLLKREGSLLDGQTYRYIEIQSLVTAFQAMHPCIGSMIACNEKGLQYGKSSVLRIECKECDAKVFLQASKN